MKLGEKIPQTINEAIDVIVSSLEKDDIDFIKSNDSASVHFTFGRALRNNWKLWAEESPIKNDFKKRFHLFGHADDISSIILIGVWAKVEGKDVDISLEQKANEFDAYWLNTGIDSYTGERFT